MDVDTKAVFNEPPRGGNSIVVAVRHLRESNERQIKLLPLVCGFCLLSGREKQRKNNSNNKGLQIKDVCVLVLLSLRSISLEIGFSHSTNCEHACHYPFNRFFR